MRKCIISLALAAALTVALIPNASASAYTMVIAPTYEGAGYFSEGLAAVKFDGKWGYIDNTGKVRILFEYDRADGFENGEAYVEVGKGDARKAYIIDKAGKVVEELAANGAGGDDDAAEFRFSEGLLATKDGKWEANGKYGFVDEDWNTVIAPRFDDAYDFSDGLADVEIDGKWGCIDRTGEEVVPIIYDGVGFFSEGLAAVNIDYKYGFVDMAGKLVIPMKHTFARHFSGGYAAVFFGDLATGKWGFINKAGDVVVPGSFEDVGFFGYSEGLAAVRLVDEDNDIDGWGFAAFSLAGASDWAVPELGSAIEGGLVLDGMAGEWQRPTNRLLAAQAIVKLIESIMDEDFHAIAEERGFDMDDGFADTDDEAVTFLKAAGISDGVDGVNYDPGGTFTRAQMVLMLGRMAENLLDADTASAPKGSERFSDVPEWADESVGWAAEASITKGVSEKLFDSNGVLTNQHTGVFAFRALSHFTIRISESEQ